MIFDKITLAPGPRFGIEGTFILMKVPNYPDRQLPPKRFEPESLTTIDDCLTAVAKGWPSTGEADSVRDQWGRWA